MRGDHNSRSTSSMRPFCRPKARRDRRTRLIGAAPLTNSRKPLATVSDDAAVAASGLAVMPSSAPPPPRSSYTSRVLLAPELRAPRLSPAADHIILALLYT
jgi:hypothetical protein